MSRRRPRPRRRTVADVAGQVSKACGALVGGVAVLTASQLLPGQLAAWLTGALTAVGAVAGVYVAPANRSRSSDRATLTGGSL